MQFTYVERLLKYCHDVINDTLPNRKSCLFEKLSCQRHLNDLDKIADPDYPYYFSEEAANKRCYFTECLQHVKGKWADSFIVLEPHQIFIQGCMYGWLKKKDDKRRFRESYIEVPRKNGKALDINTPILTTEGWKSHGDLKKGDFVFSPEGKPIKVLNTTEHYEGICYSVGFSDNDEIIAHKNHEWKTNRTWYTKRISGQRNRELPLVETWELSNTLRMSGIRKDYVHRIEMNEALSFSEKRLPINPYLLGCWLGDGSSNCSQITSMDIEIIDKIKSNWVTIKEIDTSKSLKGLAKQYSLIIKVPVRYNKKTKKHIYENLIFNNLKSLNLIKNKHIPDIYLQSSIEQRYELLRGILDTDGTISKAGQISLTLTNKRLIKDCECLFRSLGLKTTLKTGRATLYGKDCGPKYLLHCFPNNDIPLFYLPRKLERQKLVPDGKNRRSSKTVIKCELLSERHIVNCITVEGGLYLAGKGLTITHNSIDGSTSGLYMAFADGEAGSEVYSVAGSEKQAMMTFLPAWIMVNKNEDLKEYYNLQLSGTVKNPTSIYNQQDMSLFCPVVGNPGDGTSPNCALVDEYHEAPTSIAYDAMKTGMGARSQPMLIVTTTAGINTSYPCYDLHLYCVNVLKGLIEDEGIFVIIFTIDEDDNWEDFEVWKKANPNYCVSIDEDYLYDRYKDAINKPEERNILLTKHLNIWQNAGIGCFDMLRWNKCADTSLKIEQFINQECWVALDLASKIDLAALVFLFKYKRKVINTNCPKCYGDVIVKDGMNICVSGNKLENDEICKWSKPVNRDCVVGFARHYIPEETVNEKENVHYQKWKDQGHLVVTEGARTDFQLIENDIKIATERFIVKELVFDPKEASYLIQNIEKWSSFDCIEFEQGPSNISQPMKELEAMIKAFEFWHNDDPVYTWCMGNVVKKQSRSGGSVKHYFPTKTNPKLKIDSAVATICGLGRLITYENNEGAYEGRVKSGKERVLRTL